MRGHLWHGLLSLLEKILYEDYILNSICFLFMLLSRIRLNVKHYSTVLHSAAI
jgi:hypothetical protein